MNFCKYNAHKWSLFPSAGSFFVVLLYFILKHTYLLYIILTYIRSQKNGGITWVSGCSQPIFCVFQPFFGALQPFFGVTQPIFGAFPPFSGAFKPFFGVLMHDFQPFFGVIRPIFGAFQPFSGAFQPILGVTQPIFGVLNPFLECDEKQTIWVVRRLICKII